jgi:hypothetical protein
MMMNATRTCVGDRDRDVVVVVVVVVVAAGITEDYTPHTH